MLSSTGVNRTQILAHFRFCEEPQGPPGPALTPASTRQRESSELPLPAPETLSIGALLPRAALAVRSVGE